MSHGSNSQGNGKSDDRNTDNQAPLKQRHDYDDVGFAEAYDSAIEVRNSMPPPPNPNRNDQRDDT